MGCDEEKNDALAKTDPRTQMIITDLEKTRDLEVEACEGSPHKEREEGHGTNVCHGRNRENRRIGEGRDGNDHSLKHQPVKKTILCVN